MRMTATTSGMINTAFNACCPCSSGAASPRVSSRSYRGLSANGWRRLIPPSRRFAVTGGPGLDGSASTTI